LETGYEVLQLALAEAAAKALGKLAQRLRKAYNRCGHGSPPDSRYELAMPKNAWTTRSMNAFDQNQEKYLAE